MNTRNQPCQCGSGKKFKKCCMESPADAAKRNQEAWKSFLDKAEEAVSANHEQPPQQRALQSHHRTPLMPFLLAAAVLGSFSHHEDNL